MLKDMRPDRLRAVRKERGLTQKELAQKAGLRQATLSHIERGFAAPRADKLAALCRALDVSADYLLGLKDDP